MMALEKIDTCVDFALLHSDMGTLYNNVFAKGTIKNATQKIFTNGKKIGWEWDWPYETGEKVKAYPEVIRGYSPWSNAQFGKEIPCSLNRANYSVDFDVSTTAEGSWCESFDFWITASKTPRPEDITCNLCIWTRRNQIEAAYIGTHEKLTIGDRTYNAIIETPAENPVKKWNTLFLNDLEARSKGTLELKPFIDMLIDRGLAKAENYLSTVEFGNEIVNGKGKTEVRKFGLR